MYRYLTTPRTALWMLTFAWGISLGTSARAAGDDAASPAKPAASAIAVESVVLRLFNEAEVPAHEAGLLIDIAVQEGEQVERGDLLARLDDRVARLALRTAELEFEIAREKARNDVQQRYAGKALEVAEAELRRSTESIRRFPKSVSQSQLDVERLTVQKTQLEQEQAQLDARLQQYEADLKDRALAAARLEVERRRIVAPFDGTIVEVFARQGEWVEPGQKTMRIVNAQRLKAEGFVPAAAAHKSLDRAPVVLRLPTADAPHPQPQTQGRIAFVSPEVDPITGQVRVWAEIDNRDGRLRPGQRVEMWVEAADDAPAATADRRPPGQ